MKNDFLRDYLRDGKKVVVPAECEEHTDEFTDESADKVMNIIRAMTREIHDRINSISCYVGIPCKVTDVNEQASPAAVGGGKQSGYIGYTVDLKRYRNYFSMVRFRAAAPADGQGVVCGMVIDEEGNVECYAPGSDRPGCGWVRLPIGEKSAHLVATIPLDEDGNPQFIPEYVEMLPDGIVQSISEYMGEILNFSNELKEKVHKLELGNVACCGCPAKK